MEGECAMAKPIHGLLLSPQPKIILCDANFKLGTALKRQHSVNSGWDKLFAPLHEQIMLFNANGRKLRNLVKAGMLADFVKSNNGCWDHQEWLTLCGEITMEYAPIDYDQVGLALEREKDNYFYFAKKK